MFCWDDIMIPLQDLHFVHSTELLVTSSAQLYVGGTQHKV